LMSGERHAHTHQIPKTHRRAVPKSRWFAPVDMPQASVYDFGAFGGGRGSREACEEAREARRGGPCLRFAA